MPSRTTMSRSIIPNMYTEERTKLKSVLSNDLVSRVSASQQMDGSQEVVMLTFPLPVITLTVTSIIKCSTSATPYSKNDKQEKTLLIV